MARKSAHCYICGTEGARTMDHIFPRGLFPVVPPDVLTALACAECQQRLQPDEEYFRTFVASGAYRDETAKKLWDGKIVRSFANSPGLRKTFESAIRTMDYKSPGGIILGPITVVEGDQVRVGNVLRKIVRGLFYLDSEKTVMPLDVNVKFEQVTPMSSPMPDGVMELIHTMPLRKVGDVVQYKFAFPPEEPRLTVSWMGFYGRTMYVVSTWPEDMRLPLSPEEIAQVANS
jgi:hypothetical protein